MAVPSGVLWRTLATVAAYNERFQKWPTQLGLEPRPLHAMCSAVTSDELELLTERFQSVRTGEDLSVGGVGVTHYEDAYSASGEVIVSAESLAAAQNWMGSSSLEPALSRRTVMDDRRFATSRRMWLRQNLNRAVESL